MSKLLLLAAVICVGFGGVMFHLTVEAISIGDPVTAAAFGMVALFSVAVAGWLLLLSALWGSGPK